MSPSWQLKLAFFKPKHAKYNLTYFPGLRPRRTQGSTWQNCKIEQKRRSGESLPSSVSSPYSLPSSSSLPLPTSLLLPFPLPMPLSSHPYYCYLQLYTSYSTFLLHWQDFRKPILHPKKRLKSSKTLKMSLKK